MAMPSGSANGSTAAGTITPESSASQPSTGISHSTQSSGCTSGTASYASGSVRSRNHDGRHSISPDTTTTSGISGLNALTDSDPRLELILRSSRPPEFPCRVLPANAPMSDLPVAGTRKLISANTANRASPLTATSSTRRQVSRTPATARASRPKQGTMEMVPPTLPPNPGQPEANTANTATTPSASSAGRREDGYLPRKTRASQPAASRPEMP